MPDALKILIIKSVFVMNKFKTPPFARFFSPMIQVIIELGGSASRKEIIGAIITKLNISEQEQEERLKNGASKIENLINWAEIYLVKGGLLDSSNRGILSLSDKFDKDNYSDSDLFAIYRSVKSGFSYKKSIDERLINDRSSQSIDEFIEVSDYKKDLLAVLKQLSPSGFEHICQRLLREAGFEQVTVTGKTGDGGIDGHGILEINPLMSFRVVFQCKRYDGTISSSQVRDFRGAIMGRGDKGIFITTGRFSKDAINEALRDGVPPIELVWGDRLVGLFEKTQLGLKQRTTFELDHNFFSEFY